ncbi:hypothetical protein Bbelb_004770 [Branchiostoma belcheri]|nr:hypothetical protein Bbelb_004770 [Branchiostoma belcheri]
MHGNCQANDVCNQGTDDFNQGTEDYTQGTDDLQLEHYYSEDDNIDEEVFNSPCADYYHDIRDEDIDYHEIGDEDIDYHEIGDEDIDYHEIEDEDIDYHEIRDGDIENAPGQDSEPFYAAASARVSLYTTGNVVTDHTPHHHRDESFDQEDTAYTDISNRGDNSVYEKTDNQSDLEQGYYY